MDNKSLCGTIYNNLNQFGAKILIGTLGSPIVLSTQYGYGHFRGLAVVGISRVLSQ